VPAYALYRRWFVQEDTALREAVVRLTAQVEDAGSPLPKGVPDEEGKK
jgi:hypothetical protein